MRTRFFVSILAASAVVAATLAGPAWAANPKAWVKPPQLPKVHRVPTQDLNFLFGALKAAPDKESAQAIEQRIWAHWIISKSDTTMLLMSRVKTASDAGDTTLAIKLLNAVIELNPTYVEGWNQRATLYFTHKEYGPALHDIAHVLALEPRHFGALTGLGLILQDIGDDKGALKAFREALAIDPHLGRVPKIVKELSEKVDGRTL